MFYNPQKYLAVRLITLALIMSLFTACQPVPKPFAPTIAERGNPLLLLRDRAGVVVLNVTGAPVNAAQQLSNAMIKALLARNIPAWSSSGNRASYFLQGDAITNSVGDGWVQTILNWDIVDPNGEHIGQYSVSRKLRWSDWRDGSEDLIASLANESAFGIAAFMQDAIPERPASLAGQIPVFVTPVAGAPGDGENSLQIAMIAALRRAKLKIVTRKQGNTVEIVGRVQISPARKQRQNIVIIWAVRGPDGAEIGKLTQRNAVPAGSLDKAWGALAFVVADAAVGGVIDLLNIPPKKR